LLAHLYERLLDVFGFGPLFRAGHDVPRNEENTDADRRDHPDQQYEAEYRALAPF